MDAPPLAFLHTADAHVARFDAALAALAPSLEARHAVDAALLAEARAAGGVAPATYARLRDHVAALLDAGAQLVVCTCSTLGDAAERAGSELGRPVQRIDRPMAEQAVARASRLLVVAALESALAPACALLQESALRAGRNVRLRPHSCPEAFVHFEEGDLEAYRACLVASVRDALAGETGIVLAQVSMAEAAAGCAAPGTEVFCALPSGLEAALATLRRQRGTGAGS